MLPSSVGWLRSPQITTTLAPKDFELDDTVLTDWQLRYSPFGNCSLTLGMMDRATPSSIVGPHRPRPIDAPPLWLKLFRYILERHLGLAFSDAIFGYLEPQTSDDALLWDEFLQG